MSREALRQQGKEIMAALGLQSAPSPVPGLHDLMAEVVYGGVWGRPKLALADRAICTLAVLSSLQRLPSLKSMVAAALQVGLTPRNILEVFVQVGLYAGVVTSQRGGRRGAGGLCGSGTEPRPGTGIERQQ